MDQSTGGTPPHFNRRQDRYGGSLDRRLTILKDIIALARDRVGPDFPILVKLNCDDLLQGGINIDHVADLAKGVEEAGFDAIELSGGTWDCLARSKADLGFFPMPIPEARTGLQRPEDQSYFAQYARRLKLAVPVILSGGNRSPEAIESMLDQGTAEFFSLARPLIREPALPNRWREGRGSDHPACESCNACLLSLRKGPTRCLSRRRSTRFATQNLARHGWKLFLRQVRKNPTAMNLLASPAP